MHKREAPRHNPRDPPTSDINWVVCRKNKLNINVGSWYQTFYNILSGISDSKDDSVVSYSMPYTIYLYILVDVWYLL